MTPYGEQGHSDRENVVHTVCPRSLDPIYVSNLLYKIGQDFIDRQYVQEEVLSTFI